MIKKSVFEDELIAGMQRELQPFQKKAAVNDLVKAADYLHSAVEILEEAGMTAKADQVLSILAKLAHGEGSEKIEKMIEESLDPMEMGGDEPLDMESFKPLSITERMSLKPKEPEFLEVDDNDTKGKRDKDFYNEVMRQVKEEDENPEPEIIEFKSLMEPKALPPGEELVFKSIAQELGLIDDNDAKPRKPKDPTKVYVPKADDALADDLLDLEISENPIEVTETSAGKTFEDSD